MDQHLTGKTQVSKKLPLTKSRLHELLAQFDGHVTMAENGGYDTGVYF